MESNLSNENLLTNVKFVQRLKLWFYKLYFLFVHFEHHQTSMIRCFYCDCTSTIYRKNLKGYDNGPMSGIHSIMIINKITP